MKIYHYIIPIFFFLLLAPSCELLERTSPNDIDAETAIHDADSAENALIGLYNAMQSPDYYGGLYPLVGDAVTDDIETGGFDDNSLDELGGNGLTSQNIYVEAVWLSIYYTIANANYLLAALPGIDESEFEEGRKAQIEGQAKAIRAWAHFDLLRLWGEHWDTESFYGVPIVTEIQGIEQVAQRSSVPDVYAFIISELEAAAGQVSEERTDGFVDQVTVQAMLAKVFLFQKDYVQAEALASAVIESGHFALFSVDKTEEIYRSRRTPESIFELVFDGQNRSAFNTFTYTRDDAFAAELVAMSDAALGEFFAARPGDVRALLHDFDPENNDPTIQPNGRSQKYRGEEAKDNPAYILRYAELLLIRAEARGKDAGLPDLNEVRVARGLTPLDGGAMSEEEYLSALLDERRAELNFEGNNRLFDLARTQTFTSTLGLDEGEAFRAIFPIPFRETVATKGELIQNPGY